MVGKCYDIPESPVYNAEIRKIQNSDPVNADTIINPVIQQLLTNIISVKAEADLLLNRLSTLTQPGGNLDQALAGITISKSQVTDWPNSMTPTAHAVSHGVNGSDPVSPAAIGAAPAVHTHNYAGSGSAGGAAISAAKLSTARYIDGMPFNGTADIIHYGTCATAAGTAAKTATITGFKLVTGARVTIKFSAANTAANPTLNISGTGAKAIKMYGTTAVNVNAWVAGAVVEFVYDGTNWLMDTAMASRLSAARTMRTNLASTAAASFDGSANITPGVIGVLPVANGGTGASSLEALLSTLQSNGVAKIATGSYVGTGTYGVNNPCSLTFPFVPKLVSLGCVSLASISAQSARAWVNRTAGETTGVINNNKEPERVIITWNGKTVSWWSNTSANHQLNNSTLTYCYVVIG